jgi:hypothetical protein
MPVLELHHQPSGPVKHEVILERRHSCRQEKRSLQNWQIIFSKDDRKVYAEQLDFFRIELGVIQPGSTIVCVSHLSKPKPETHTVIKPYLNENRYYLCNKDDFRDADTELLKRAGIEVGGRLIFKFLPRSVELELVKLENSYCGVNPRNIKSTTFAVRPATTGFEFHVVDQVVSTTKLLSKNNFGVLWCSRPGCQGRRDACTTSYSWTTAKRADNKPLKDRSRRR